MPLRIVADGASRFSQDPQLQAQLAQLLASIRARYTAELAATGFFRRWLIRRRIAAEFRRERARLLPSPHALYLGDFREKHLP